MKYGGLILCLLLMLPAFGADKKTYKPRTQRAPAQYLTTDALQVTDTCPGADIINPFTCTKDQTPGFTCFDVYRV